MIFVSSSEFFSISSLNLNIILALWSGGLLDQDSKAFCAFDTASDTSFVEANFTSALCSPVAGLNTLLVLLESPEKFLPPTKC